MKTTQRLIAFSAFSLVLLHACKKDEDLPNVPQPVINEPEEITTVELHVESMTDMSHVHFYWSDPDGPGGNDPVIDDIVLDSGHVYKVEIDFLDESGTTPENITAQILEEDDEHIICFETEPTALADALTIVRTDSDGTYEVGLDSEWTTSARASGTLKIKLKHQTGGIKDGTCEPGDTDIEVVFNLTIQ
jgi:hypothetical protein